MHPPTLRIYLDNPVILKIFLKVNLKSLTDAYEHFFLYDLENIIKPIFATEVQKEFSIYGLISFSGDQKKKKKLDQIKPGDNLKFELIDDVYINSLSFELGKVHMKKSFNIVSDKFCSTIRLFCYTSILLYCEQKKTKERVKKEQ